MRLYDTHTHCLHSFDSTAALDDMINTAIQKGLSGICFTDHHDIDFPKEAESDPDAILDIPKHIHKIKNAAEHFKDSIEVLCGIEIGMQPHVTAQNSAIIRDNPFDFVIASVHVLNGEDPYYGHVFENHDESEVFRDYFDSILENINLYNDFDVLGHLDYIVRYSPEKDKNYTYERYSDIIDDILIKLISTGKGLEINSSGLKSGLKNPNPGLDILKRYRDLGGNIITMGSDAHDPGFIGYEFDKLAEILKNAGFDHYNVFRERKPIDIPL